MRSPLRPLKTQSIARLSSEIHPGVRYEKDTPRFKSAIVRVERVNSLLLISREAEGENFKVSTEVSIVGSLRGPDPVVDSLAYRSISKLTEGPEISTVFDDPVSEISMSGLICVKNLLRDVQGMPLVSESQILLPTFAEAQ